MFKRFPPNLFRSSIKRRPKAIQSLLLLSRSKTWTEILLLGLLIAIGISIWPTAQCALGACSARDAWCDFDCSKSCSASTGLGVVTGCGTYNPVGGYCPESGWSPNSVKATCSSASNCNVTSVDRYSSHLSQRNGRSFWSAGGCVYDPSASGSCRLVPSENTGRVDCCSGSSGPGPGGSGGPPPCTPTYGPPTIALGGYLPAYPLVFTQDPDRLGTTVSIIATGGGVSNGCNQGASNARISDLSLDEVKLSVASSSWIQSYLASRYPGARVKGSYPLTPDVEIGGLNSSSATLQFHYEPLDPGYYEVRVSATQSDGQTASATLSISAFLLDTTLTLPQP